MLRKCAIFSVLLVLPWASSAQLSIVSNQQWKASLTASPGWETVGFNDAAWPQATSPALNPCTPVIAGTQSMWWPDINVTDVYFRYGFMLNGTVQNASCQVTADNQFFLYVNGIYVGTGNNWSVVYSFNLQPFLQCGNNVIAIHGVEFVPGTCNLVTFLATIDTIPVPAPTISANLPICEGDDLQLNANGQPGSTFHWTGPGGFNTVVQNPVIAQVGAQHGGIYQAYTDLNGCTSPPGQINVAINLAPNVTFIPKRESCFPGNDGFVDLFLLSGQLPISYAWSNGETTEDIFNLGTGWYHVTVTDSVGCTLNDSAYVDMGYPSGPVDTAVWTGYISDDWFEPCNWDKVVLPDSGFTVLIPGSTIFQPVLSGSVGYCKNLVILVDSGGTLTIVYNSGGKLIKSP